MLMNAKGEQEYALVTNEDLSKHVGHRMEMKPTRNLRDVWTINTQPHKEAHPAMWPEPLVERCIRIGSKEGDVVLDPFAGSGATGRVARNLGRNSILIDSSEEYVELMKPSQHHGK